MKAAGGRLFRVLPRQAGGTLAEALAEWLPDEQRKKVSKLISSGQVMVSGNVCLDVRRRLRLKDVVKLLPHPITPPPKETDIRIRYLDADIVVVEKPAGMTSVRCTADTTSRSRRRLSQPTLDELLPRLLARLEHVKKRRSPHVLPVHRLDRECSGLMVFARNAVAERHLTEQFRRHAIGRRYLAIVHGDVEEHTITSRLVRNRGDGLRGSTSQPEAGKTAVTYVRPVERLGDYTLVECRLETGRTHQIRIHLAEEGHPLCGEQLYNKPLGGVRTPDRSGAPRLALAAVELEFTHPQTGKRMHFKSALPKDLARFLRRLRRNTKD